LPGDIPQVYSKDVSSALYIENHDQARSVSRFGNDSPEFRDISAKMLATMHCTLSGTVYVYEGQELAMANVPKSWGIEDYPDVASITFYEEIKANRKKENPGLEPDMSDIVAGLQHKARDNARTPMQWSAAKNAGFSANPEKAKDPWMKVNEDYKLYNAEVEAQNKDSPLNFWKKAIQFRKDHLACVSL
jgi:alpha-glucosidase